MGLVISLNSQTFTYPSFSGRCFTPSFSCALSFPDQSSLVQCFKRVNSQSSIRVEVEGHRYLIALNFQHLQSSAVLAIL